MKNADNFLLHKERHHVKPSNQHFSLSAKMNGTQGRKDKGPEEYIAHAAVDQKAPFRLK